MGLFQRKAEENRDNEDIIDANVIESNIESNEEEARDEIKSETVENFTDNALNCLGWKEVKTEKWLIRSARIWYGIMSFCWFMLGAFTFAPIIFICNKINVIFKNKKKSLGVAVCIYALIVALIVILMLSRG